MKQDLTIRISADIKKFQDKLKSVKGDTEDLNNSLKSAATKAGIAFAGLTVAIGGTVAQAAKMETLQSQFEVLTGSVGDATRAMEDLKEFSAGTPFQFEDIAKAGQKLLAFGFSADELKDRLKEIGDVSAAVGAPLGDLTLIFGQVAAAGKLTGERFNQLKERAVPIGPALAKTMGVAESSLTDLVSQGKVTAEVFQKAFASMSQEGGQAFQGLEKVSGTLGGKLSTLQDNVALLAAAIGEQFLPFIAAATDGLTDFLKYVNDNKEFAKWAAIALAVGAALTGLITVLALASSAFLTISAAITALGGASAIAAVPMTALGTAIQVAISPITLAIVAIGAFVYALYKFRNEVMTIMQGVGELLVGVFTFDYTKIKEGFSKAKAAVLRGAGEIKKDFMSLIPSGEDDVVTDKVTPKPDKVRQKMDETKTVIAEKSKELLKLEEDFLAAKQALNMADRELSTQLELQFETERAELLLELRTQELTQEQQHQLALLELVKQRRAEELRGEMTDQQLKEKLQLKHQIELAKIKNDAREAELNARNKYELELAKKQAEERAQYLKDEIEFGKAYADARRNFRSEDYQNAKSTMGDLSYLQKSTNKDLFRVGQAAALAMATMNIAEGITKALTLPFPASLAAGIKVAAVGATQISAITGTSIAGFADGGIVTGGLPGRDTVPIMAQRGELIAPPKSFDEVINGVIQQRANQGAPGAEGGANTAQTVEIRFREDAYEILEYKLLERNQLGISLG